MATRKRLVLYQDWETRVSNSGDSRPSSTEGINKIINSLYFFDNNDFEDVFELEYEDYKHLVTPEEWINPHNTGGSFPEVAVQEIREEYYEDSI